MGRWRRTAHKISYCSIWTSITVQLILVNKILVSIPVHPDNCYFEECTKMGMGSKTGVLQHFRYMKTRIDGGQDAFMAAHPSNELTLNLLAPTTVGARINP